MTASRLGVLLAICDPAAEARAVAALDAPGSGARVVRRCVDLADLLAAAAAGRGQVAVVSAELRRLDGEALSRLVAGGCAVVGLHGPGDEAAERRLRQLGVRVVLPENAPAEVLVGAVRSATGHPDPEPALAAPPPVPRERDVPESTGRVVAVWGPAGAPGRTSVATALAVEAAELRQPALLVDADPYGGAVAPALGLLDEASGLVAACRAANAGALDVRGLAGLAREVLPGLAVLTGLPRADRWPELRPAALAAVLEAARGLARLVVVDTGFCLELDEELAYDVAAPRRNGATLTALDSADVVVAVGAADPLGLQRLVRGLAELRERLPEVQPRVVVTRVRPGPTGPGSPEDAIRAALARYAGVERAVLVPDDRPAHDRAVAAGRALAEVAPRSASRPPLRALAAELAGVGLAEPRRRRRVPAWPAGRAALPAEVHQPA